MSPFVAYHATGFRHRESIREHGLLVDCCFQFRDQPERIGVYVYNDDCAHPTFRRSPANGRVSVWWGSWGNNDTWRVSYIGPLAPDEFVENGLILYESVPPHHLILITHITPNSGEEK